MPNNEQLQAQLAQWGVLAQAMALMDAGFSITDALWLVYKAHMGKAECMIQKGV